MQDRVCRAFLRAFGLAPPLHNTLVWRGSQPQSCVRAVARPIIRGKTVRHDNPCAARMPIGLAPRAHALLARYPWTGHADGGGKPLHEAQQPRSLHRKFVGTCRTAQASRRAVDGAKMHAAALLLEPAASPCRQPRHVDRARGAAVHAARKRPRPRGLAQERGQRAASAWCGVRRKLAAGLIQRRRGGSSPLRGRSRGSRAAHQFNRPRKCGDGAGQTATANGSTLPWLLE